MPHYQLVLALSSRTSLSNIWSDVAAYKGPTLGPKTYHTRDYRFGSLRVDWVDIQHKAFRPVCSPSDKHKESEDTPTHPIAGNMEIGE